MNNFNAASLKSASVGKLLLRLLWVRLGFAGVAVLFSLLDVIAKPIYQLVAGIDGLISIVALIINIISVILFLIWLHRLHADLKNLFQEYPITPGGAVARFLIPVYNIWGMANVLSTFADKFRPEGGDLTSFSEEVRASIGLLYGFTIVSQALTRFLLKESFNNPQNESLTVWYLLSTALDLGIAFVLLQLTKNMGTAVIQKSKRVIA